MIVQYAFNIKCMNGLDEFDKFMNMISCERKSRIERFYFLKDKVHSLFAEVVLRYALWDLYRMNNTQIQFGKMEYGKPYLIGNEDIHFNLSHSGDWVLCGIGNAPMGVDVQQIEDTELLTVNTVFSEEEHKFISKQLLEDRKQVFFKIWTLKESYVKKIGLGIKIPFDSFSFKICGEEIFMYQQGIQKKDYYFCTEQLDEEHCTAICIDSKYFNILEKNIRILTMEELKEWYKVQNR